MLIQSRDHYEGRPPYDPLSYFDGGRKTPGPLTMSALALFGNGSWLDTVFKYTANMSHTDDTNDSTDLWQITCRGMPFGKMQSMDTIGLLGYQGHDVVSKCRFQEDDSLMNRQNSYDDLMLLAHDIMTHLTPSKNVGLENVEKLLSISMFVANRALLTFYSPDVDRSSVLENGRLIYSSPGVLIQKPVLSRAAIIALSILIGIQILGLGYLTRYIRSAPTWCAQLDSMALVRIGADLGKRQFLPPLGPVDKKDFEALETIQALVGIVESKECDESSIDEPELRGSRSDEESADIELQLLASRDEIQVISRDNMDIGSQSDGSEGELQETEERNVQHVRLALGAPGIITSKSI